MSDYEMSPLGIFLKGPNRLQEAMERRAERIDKMQSEIRENHERRTERLFVHFKRWLEDMERTGAIDSYGFPRIAGGSISAAYTLVTGTVFAMTAGAKTVLNAIAPSGHGLALVHFDISFDGVTSTAVPAAVDVVSSTQAGAGTSGVTPTITQVRGRSSGGSAPTGGSNYTAEPTVLVNLRKLYIPQLMGTYSYDFPLGREFECDASGGTIKALALRGNVTANVNALANMEVEAVG